MDDDVAQVDQDPLTRFFTFDRDHVAASRLGLVTHVAGNGPALPIRSRRGDDDPVEERGQLGGIKDLNVLSLDIFECVDHDALQFAQFHGARGSPLAI